MTERQSEIYSSLSDVITTRFVDQGCSHRDLIVASLVFVSGVIHLFEEHTEVQFDDNALDHMMDIIKDTVKRARE